MSYGSWWVAFEARGFTGKGSDVVFDMESQGEMSDFFWFTLSDDESTISIEHSATELHADSEDMLGVALKRLHEVHEAEISGYGLTDGDSGIRYRGEFDNSAGDIIWASGIEPSEYTVEQLQKIHEYAKALREEVTNA